MTVDVSIGGLKSVINRSSSGEKVFQFTLRLAIGGEDEVVEAKMVRKIELWWDDNSFRLTISFVRYGRLTLYVWSVNWWLLAKAWAYHGRRLIIHLLKRGWKEYYKQCLRMDVLHQVLCILGPSHREPIAAAHQDVNICFDHWVTWALVNRRNRCQPIDMSIEVNDYVEFSTKCVLTFQRWTSNRIMNNNELSQSCAYPGKVTALCSAATNRTSRPTSTLLPTKVPAIYIGLPSFKGYNICIILYSIDTEKDQFIYIA